MNKSKLIGMISMASVAITTPAFGSSKSMVGVQYTNPQEVANLIASLKPSSRNNVEVTYSPSVVENQEEGLNSTEPFLVSYPHFGPSSQFLDKSLTGVCTVLADWDEVLEELETLTPAELRSTHYQYVGQQLGNVGDFWVVEYATSKTDVETDPDCSPTN